MEKNAINVLPRHVQDLISHLEFFSQLKPSIKPCIHQRTFVDASSWYGSIYRIIYKEKRSELVAYLKQMVDNYISTARDYPEFLPIIEPSLRRARKGILHLFETYRQSEDFKSDLKVVMIMIDLNLGMCPEEISRTWDDERK